MSPWRAWPSTWISNRRVSPISGKPPRIGHFAAQQAIHSIALVGKVRTHPGDEHEVGLSGFDHDSGRHPPLVQPPRVGGDIGFGPQRSRAGLTRFGVNAEQPIRQQQRRFGHPYLAEVVVLHGERRPVDVGNLARGMHAQAVLVEREAYRVAFDCRLRQLFVGGPSGLDRPVGACIRQIVDLSDFVVGAWLSDHSAHSSMASAVLAMRRRRETVANAHVERLCRWPFEGRGQ